MIFPETGRDFKTECKDKEGFTKHEGEEWVCTMPVI